MKLPIDEAYVDAQARNPAAIKNGRAILLKKKLLACHESEDGLIFGVCAGSGAERR